MRVGIHRGFENAVERRVWVAEACGDPGEWLTEVEYRAAGYSPEFDELPILIVRNVSVHPLRIEDLPEGEREYVERQLREKNA